MINTQKQDFSEKDYANDKNDALGTEDNTEHIKEISGDDVSIEADKDRLEQADEASRPSYELNLDDEKSQDS